MTEIDPIPNDVATPVHDTKFETFSDSEGENKENEVAFNLEGFLRTIELETKHTRNFAKGSHGTKPHSVPQNTQESITPLNANHPQIKSGTSTDQTTVKVRIHFNTLIHRKYYEKIDAICLRIGHKYFQHFKISIVPFEAIELVRVHGCEFVTLHGYLEFPTKKISNSGIRFPYKYYYYYKSGEESYEHLHHTSNINYNRYYNWDTVKTPINSLDNNTYEHFDMMILPETSRERSSSIHGLVNRKHSKIISHARTDVNIPFYNISERILVSFEAFLPSNYGCGYSYPLPNLAEFLYQFQYLVLTLCHAKLEDPNYTKLISCDSSVTATKLCSILVKLWMQWCYTPEENSRLGDATIVNKFYLGCMLLDSYNIRRTELNSKLITTVLGSIESILRNKNIQLHDSTVANTPFKDFKDKIQNSVQNFIFNSSITSSRDPKNILTLIPIYHMILNPKNEADSLHKELKYTENEYWGYPANTSVFSTVTFEYRELQKPLALTEYDTLLSYTIVIHALNETNAQQICDYFIKNSQYCPLSALMGALLFRLSSSKSNSYTLLNDCNLRTITMRSLVNGFTEHYAKFVSEDIFRLNSLTITFALKLPIKHFNYEQFKLCLNLISNTYGYCNMCNSQRNIPSAEITKLFKDFVINWYTLNISKMDMLYQDYIYELDFWEDMISGYSFSPIWRSNVEEFLKEQFTVHQITQEYLTDIIIDLQTKHPSRNSLKELFINQLISHLKCSMTSKERNQLVKRFYQAFSEINQLKVVREVFNQVLIAEKGHFERSESFHFVTWQSWDLYFTLLNIDNILSVEVEGIITEAIYPHFTGLLDEIGSLDIRLGILEKIQTNTDYFVNLIETFRNSIAYLKVIYTKTSIYV